MKCICKNQTNKGFFYKGETYCGTTYVDGHGITYYCVTDSKGGTYEFQMKKFNSYFTIINEVVTVKI